MNRLNKGKRKLYWRICWSIFQLTSPPCLHTCPVIHVLYFAEHLLIQVQFVFISMLLLTDSTAQQSSLTFRKKYAVWVQNVANPYTLTAVITTVKSLVKCALWSLLINWQAYCIFAFRDSHAECVFVTWGFFGGFFASIWRATFFKSMHIASKIDVTWTRSFACSYNLLISRII